MSSRTMTFAVSEEVFARIRERARQAKRTMEAEVADVVAEAFGDQAPPDIEGAAAAIGFLAEPALRVAAESRLSRKESARLAALHRKRQKDGLTRAEDKERRELMRRYEKAMVVRATALAELHRRGIDVSEFVAP
jgi:uncharacterized protein YnzC (UPF0291/DUF896 family)